MAGLNCWIGLAGSAERLFVVELRIVDWEACFVRCFANRLNWLDVQSEKLELVWAVPVIGSMQNHRLSDLWNSERAGFEMSVCVMTTRCFWAVCAWRINRSWFGWLEVRLVACSDLCVSLALKGGVFDENRIRLIVHRRESGFLAWITALAVWRQWWSPTNISKYPLRARVVSGNDVVVDFPINRRLQLRWELVLGWGFFYCARLLL